MNRSGLALGESSARGQLAFVRRALRKLTASKRTEVHVPRSAFDTKSLRCLEAASRGDLKCLERIMGSKFFRLDVNTQDHNGVTMLMLAAAAGHLNVVRYLLAHRAAVNAKDFARKTALHHAVRGEKYCFHRPLEHPVVQLLVEAGANVEAQDADGLTAIEIAISHRNGAASFTLCCAGAQLTDRAMVSASTQSRWTVGECEQVHTLHFDLESESESESERPLPLRLKQQPQAQRIETSQHHDHNHNNTTKSTITTSRTRHQPQKISRRRHKNTQPTATKNHDSQQPQQTTRKAADTTTTNQHQNRTHKHSSTATTPTTPRNKRDPQPQPRTPPTTTINHINGHNNGKTSTTLTTTTE